jgi:hypothetical protein
MDPLDAINFIALKHAAKPDAESNLRYVMRWYSKTFSTPLHQVMHEIPLEDIWLAFFEERYAGMEREDLEEHIAEALETPEERRARLTAEEEEKAGNDAFVRMTEEAAKATATKQEPVPFAPPVMAETKPDAPIEVPPDIAMTFVTPEEMEKLLGEGVATETKEEPIVKDLSFR